MQPQSVQSLLQNPTPEAKQVSSFKDRMVEFAPIVVVAGAAYALSVPVAAIAIGVGCFLVYKSLFTRLTTTADPFTLKLEKLKSLGAKEKLVALEEFAKDYDTVSAKNQVAFIKETTTMLNDDQEVATAALKIIRTLIKDKKLNAETFVGGFAAFFEKVAIEKAETTKKDVLCDSIELFYQFFVESRAEDEIIDTQKIDLIKLHSSLDNLIIDSKSLKQRIVSIKGKLPLSTTDELVLQLKYLESQNMNIRRVGIYRLIDAYDNIPDLHLAIIEAIFKMLNDNINFDLNQAGDNALFRMRDLNSMALGVIQLLVQKYRLNTDDKFQAFINGCANYLNQVGSLQWEQLFQDNNHNMSVLRSILEVVILQDFIPMHSRVFANRKEQLAPLVQSLEDLKKKIPTTTSSPILIRTIDDILNKLS